MKLSVTQTMDKYSSYILPNIGIQYQSSTLPLNYMSTNNITRGIYNITMEMYTMVGKVKNIMYNYPKYTEFLSLLSCKIAHLCFNIKIMPISNEMKVGLYAMSLPWKKANAPRR